MTHLHDHGHDHHDEIPSTLSFEEKMIKLLDHWVKHNDDHARSYGDWAAKAKASGMGQVASLLEDAAAMTRKISDTFEEAAQVIQS